MRNAALDCVPVVTKKQRRRQLAHAGAERRQERRQRRQLRRRRIRAAVAAVLVAAAVAALAWWISTHPATGTSAATGAGGIGVDYHRGPNGVSGMGADTGPGWAARSLVKVR